MKKLIAFLMLLMTAMHGATYQVTIELPLGDLVKHVVEDAVIKHSNKWLAEMLGKDQATISKWCTNTCQPDLETLIRISDLLKVDVNDLLKKECIKE